MVCGENFSSWACSLPIILGVEGIDQNADFGDRIRSEGQGFNANLGQLFFQLGNNVDIYSRIRILDSRILGVHLGIRLLL